MRSISNLFKYLYAGLKYRITKKKFKIVMSEQAQKFLSKVSEEDRKKLEAAIEEISKNPYVGEVFTKEDWDELDEEEREALKKGLKWSAELRNRVEKEENNPKA